ncbi:hypothetical protein Tco_1212607, partial [Tanacetum coccineum]
NYGVLGEVMLKDTHFGAYTKSFRKSTDLTENTPYYSRPIRRIQDFYESKDHWLTLKNTPYPHQRYAIYNTLVNEEESTVFTSIRPIVYNNAPTSKSDLLTEPTLSPQHIDEFNLKDETSLSECDEEEQNIICFNDLFPFNVIYPDDLKSDKDNDDDKIDIEQSSGVDTAYSLNEYSVFDTGINTAYPGEPSE